MHAEVMDLVRKVTAGRESWPLVYDIGGRDINGSPRGIVPHEKWVGIDLHPGPGVDVVTDVRDWQPDMQADLVLCLEVLEHAPEWRDVVRACVRLTAPGGMLVVTCAADPRAPHSSIDGGALREGEHYANIDNREMFELLHFDLVVPHNQHHDAIRGDIYVVAHV